MVELLRQLDVHLDSLDTDLLTGDSPVAEENRAIRGAQANLARRRAVEVRAALARTREHARHLASRMRALRESRPDHPSPADGGGAELARALDTAARRMAGYRGLDQAVELIVRGALDAVPQAGHVGVTLTERDGRITSREPSDDVVRDLDRLQDELGEGPCVDAIRRGTRTLVPDMADADDVWPRFAPAAVERGVRPMVSFPLFQSAMAGALTFCSDTAGSFDDHALDVAALFASQAALVLQGAGRIDQLNVGLQNRDLIGQAKGILVERFGTDSEQAFAMLVESSQQTNIKLNEVARWVVRDAIERRDGSP
ncbi:GAF and ANTAR domain-containing protein [Actinomycetospora rhizophila]|uniref:GAF and ANTAR domain-containing protein n=1 Tax=Actinomycetospora rhizophila TaxID=1416876 RepID=A0ABV9ZPC5_9PSEU